MPKQVKRRRGTTAQHASFTGAAGEITVDTTKKTVVVHDGATAGGFPLASETALLVKAAGGIFDTTRVSRKPSLLSHDEHEPKRVPTGGGSCGRDE
jgi:hypothetical protein